LAALVPFSSAATHPVFPGMAEHFNLDRGDRARFTIVSVGGRTVTIVAA
jgi:hypothetical protein